MIRRYDIYLNLPATGAVLAANMAIIEESNRVTAIGFRYHSEYLNNPRAVSLDPALMPLSTMEYRWDMPTGLPAILDDYLPDRWGRKVLNRLALYREQKRLSSNSVIDILSLMGSSVIGAISIVPKGETPVYGVGCSIEMLPQAEQAAQDVEHLSANTATLDEMSLLHLANHGSGVGGARPKALVYDSSGAYLAKFNRHADQYNNARIELACLRMAKAAGIECFEGHVAVGINGREVLLLDRFDLTANGSRHHMITINGLLKEPKTLADTGQSFRYDDVLHLLKLYSTQFSRDRQQLVKQMLFNRAIHNKDDHERNFSLLYRGDGYVLSPAYDMVPSFERGAYHLAGFGCSPNPPTPTEAATLKRLFGLTQTDIQECANAVSAAVNRWPEFADSAGVSEQDMNNVKQYFCL
ncbi:type II toxin-antitoxin system HipA family toxin [Gilvimarinus polysaccharolyticus]|uniref:type II toxin-antitoxin system HipA family toxin n=1 Tax=Gilvimarinus polysaccharolyticus TaxID=863921 RepID=UPI00067312A0|nr:type II toxin-antitoxin system HipA family toxin [Gilvimarinus polysaccharolyticus]